MEKFQQLAHGDTAHGLVQSDSDRKTVGIDEAENEHLGIGLDTAGCFDARAQLDVGGNDTARFAFAISTVPF